MTFAQLKVKTLENMAALEIEGVVKKSNHYQDMLNIIAKDMLNKHRRRSQRARELETLRNTLGNLKEKAVYLTEQKKSYIDYVDSCIKQIGNKNGLVGGFFCKGMCIFIVTFFCSHSPFIVARARSNLFPLPSSTITSENCKRVERYQSLVHSR